MHAIKDFFKTIYDGIVYSFKNFPLIFIWLITIAILLILKNHDIITFISDEDLRKLIISIVSICLMSLSVTIYTRSNDKPASMNLIGQLLSIIAGVLMYWIWIHYTESTMMHFSIMITFLLIILKVFLSYRKNLKEEKEDVWYYYSDIIWHAAIGFIYGTTIMIGLFAIIKSVLYLFDIWDNGIWMSDIATISYALVMPLVFLTNTKFDTKKYEISKFVNFFWKYVLVSLLIIYALVILSYIFKIVVTQERPKGILIYMIYWFATIGLATLYILHPLKQENTNYNIRQKIFGGLLIIFLGVWAMSIYIRIKNYGFTWPRYIVILLLIWFLYIGFSYLLRKKTSPQQDIFVLVILGAVGVFAWPINMYNIVKINQLNRWEDILSKNGMLDNNKSIISWNYQDKVSTGDIVALSSIVDYLSDKYSPAIFSKYIPWWYNPPSSSWKYDRRSDDYNKYIMNSIWLSYDRNHYYPSSIDFPEGERYFSYFADQNRTINLSDYYLYHFNRSEEQAKEETSQKLYSTYDKDNNTLSWTTSEGKTCSVNIEEVKNLVRTNSNLQMKLWNSQIIELSWTNCILYLLNANIQSIGKEKDKLIYMEGIIAIEKWYR